MSKQKYAAKKEGWREKRKIMRTQNNSSVAQAVSGIKNKHHLKPTHQTVNVKRKQGTKGSVKIRNKSNQLEQNYKLPKYQKKFFKRKKYIYQNYNTHGTIK